jgi:hypothetical protein
VFAAELPTRLGQLAPRRRTEFRLWRARR